MIFKSIVHNVRKSTMYVRTWTERSRSIFVILFIAGFSSLMMYTYTQVTQFNDHSQNVDNTCMQHYGN